MTDITALDEVQAAEADYEAAEKNAAATAQAEADLEQKIINGEAVTPAALDKATTATRFARLRALAARKRADQAAAKRKADEEEKLLEDAKATLDRLMGPESLERFRDKYVAVVEAIRELQDATDLRVDEENEISNAVSITKAAGIHDYAGCHSNSATIGTRGTQGPPMSLKWTSNAVEEAIGVSPRPVVVGGDPDLRRRSGRVWELHYGDLVPRGR